jgi:hypothetical protein
MALAFRIREEKGEQALSGDHFEYYDDDHYANIIKAMEKRHLKLSPNGRLLKLHCGTTIQKAQPLCAEEVYFERDANSSHTGLYGLAESHLVAGEILRSCIIELSYISPTKNRRLS